MEGFMSLIGAIWESWYVVVWLAVLAAAGASLLAAAVLTINVFFRRWLSARQMGWLWGVVLIRLLIPIAPGNSFSLQSLVWSIETETATTSVTTEQAGPHPDPQADSESRVAALAPYALPSPGTPDAPAEFDIWDIVDKWFPTVSVIWLIGAAASLTATIIVQWQFGRRLRHAIACDNPRLLALWSACCQQARVRRRIPILQFDAVRQPAVLGLFRPQLLLPTDTAELNDEQLRMIMLHELAHVKRWDIAGNYLLVVIRAVHWWNPVYWLAAARFLNLREQACDAFAIQNLEGSPTRSYSELLLTLTQREQSGGPWRVTLPASLLGFMSSYFRTRAMHNRLHALRTAGVTHGRWHTISVGASIGLLAFCGLTDAKSPEVLPAVSPADWFPSADRIAQNWSAPLLEDHSPSESRDYDMEKALQRISQDEWSSDAELQ